MRYDKRNEVYHWIKIRSNLMHSTEVKLLMRQHDGGWYFSIYLYLIMLSINSGGRLTQKVNNVEMVYDLTTITQELMFFKIDTIRVAIEMLKELNLLYTDDEDVLCIANFDSLVGQESGWADKKRRQRQKFELTCGDNVPSNVPTKVPALVHENVPPEYRDKSIEYRDKIKDKEKNDFYDFNDGYESNDSITLPSDSEVINKLKNLVENEWVRAFTHAHIFTKYLINSKYFEHGDIENLLSANAFFEYYLEEHYTFEEMKNHVQFFLLQFRKKSKKERAKIKNRMGYFTNALKTNKRTLEWRDSTEFEEMKTIHETVAKILKEEASRIFPNDEMRQNCYVDEFYLSKLGAEMRRIRRDFEKKTTVR